MRHGRAARKRAGRPVPSSPQTRPLDSRPGEEHLPGVLIWGHRGASADRAENTLPAFLEAIRQGADGVELDAMVCGSGEVVVCHDEWLDRVAGAHVLVRQAPWAELRAYDVGTRLGFSSARIPLLDEVLDAVPPQATVNVELKCDSPDDGGLALAVAGRLAERRLEERALVSSFNPGLLRAVAGAAPQLRRGLLLDPERPLEPQVAEIDSTSTWSVHPHWSHCTRERVAEWRGRGLRVVAWTVDRAELAAALEDCGVACCITNRPGALRAGLEELQRPAQ